LRWVWRLACCSNTAFRSPRSRWVGAEREQADEQPIWLADPAVTVGSPMGYRPGHRQLACGLVDLHVRTPADPRGQRVSSGQQHHGDHQARGAQCSS
jgi:hypothetical protein